MFVVTMECWPALASQASWQDVDSPIQSQNSDLNPFAINFDPVYQIFYPVETRSWNDNVYKTLAQQYKPIICITTKQQCQCRLDIVLPMYKHGWLVSTNNLH